jgi:hypothetical protein
MNEVERQIRLPQNQISQSGACEVTAEDKQQAKKQTIDDFIYNSNLQTTVLAEMKEFQQNTLAKTPTLDGLLRAQTESLTAYNDDHLYSEARS